MKRYLICRNKYTQKCVIIRNGEKLTLNTTEAVIACGGLYSSTNQMYINILEKSKNKTFAMIGSLEIKEGDTAIWDENLIVSRIYSPSNDGVYSITTQNTKNKTQHRISNSTIVEWGGIVIFDSVFITELGLQVGLYRDTIPLIIGRSYPGLVNNIISNVIYINERLTKYYCVTYNGGNKFTFNKNETRQHFLQLPENVIIKDGMMLSGWSDNKLIYGRPIDVNAKDISYDIFQSKEWEMKYSLTEIINATTRVFINIDYGMHKSDGCFNMFLLYMLVNMNNETWYTELGVDQTGFVYVGDTNRVCANDPNVREILDVDKALTFMLRYRELMNARDSFESELLSNKVEQSCVNVICEYNYRYEDRAKSLVFDKSAEESVAK